MILFLINKNLSISDIIVSTDIRSNNFWFQYFMNLFSKQSERFENLTTLVKFLKTSENSVYNTTSTADILNKLKLYEIDGDFFIQKHILFVTNNFVDIDFTKIKSRQIKVIDF